MLVTLRFPTTRVGQDRGSSDDESPSVALNFIRRGVANLAIELRSVTDHEERPGQAIMESVKPTLPSRS